MMPCDAPAGCNINLLKMKPKKKIAKLCCPVRNSCYPLEVPAPTLRTDI